MSQAAFDSFCKWVRATEDAPRDPFRVLEHRHGLAEIVARGGGVPVERHRVHHPHPEREIITVSENASCHGNRFAHECLGFFEVLQTNEGHRVVAGC